MNQVTHSRRTTSTKMGLRLKEVRADTSSRCLSGRQTREMARYDLRWPYVPINLVVNIYR